MSIRRYFITAVSVAVTVSDGGAFFFSGTQVPDAAE